MINKFLTGLIAAPFTPMDDEGELNHDVIGTYANFLIDKGVKGAFVCGTTGEGPSLTLEERKALVEEWVRCSEGRLKIIAHVGGTCQSDCMELAEHAADVGADAIAAMSPFFFKPQSAKELLMFFKPISEAAGELPFYYYHIPSMTGVDLSAYEILKKAEEIFPKLAGVKFTHFDLMDLQQCLELNGRHYNLLFGRDETLLCGLSLGVESAVGSTYNYMAPVYTDLIEAFQKNDLQEARKCQESSVQLVQILNKYGGGVRAGKAIMEFIGIDCGPCRLPIKRMTSNERESFRNDLESISFFEKTGIKQKL